LDLAPAAFQHSLLYFTKRFIILKNCNKGMGMVALVCNPSYAGGRDQED
jgi:hypothetical protein